VKQFIIFSPPNVLANQTLLNYKVTETT